MSRDRARCRCHCIAAAAPPVARSQSYNDAQIAMAAAVAGIDLMALMSQPLPPEALAGLPVVPGIPGTLGGALPGGGDPAAAAAAAAAAASGFPGFGLPGVPAAPAVPEGMTPAEAAAAAAAAINAKLSMGFMGEWQHCGSAMPSVHVWRTMPNFLQAQVNACSPFVTRTHTHAVSGGYTHTFDHMLFAAASACVAETRKSLCSHQYVR
jgi:hypothetical protein